MKARADHRMSNRTPTRAFPDNARTPDTSSSIGVSLAPLTEKRWNP